MHASPPAPSARRAEGFCKLGLTLGCRREEAGREAGLLKAGAAAAPNLQPSPQLQDCENIKINAVLTPGAGPTFLISA